MTAVIAFTSRIHKTSFVGSDDLEGHSGSRCDKVWTIFNRYIFATVGIDIIEDAARFADIFGHKDTYTRNFVKYQPPSSIEEYCQLVASLLPRTVPHREAQVKCVMESGRLTEAHRQELYAGRSLLVIVDTEKHRICEANFGILLPPRSAYVFTIRELPKERAIRFGINEPLDLGIINKPILEHPFAWCRERIQEARSEAESAGFYGSIGELGSCHKMRNNRLEVRTAFETLEEAAARFFPEIKKVGTS